MIKTTAAAIERKEELLKSVNEKFSRYCNGDFSNFADAHGIIVAIINAGYYLPQDWPGARPTLDEYMELMEILIAFVQKEPKSSTIYQRVDNRHWEPKPYCYPRHPFQEDRVLGYWFRKLLQEIIQMEARNGGLSPAGAALVGVCSAVLS